MKHLPWSEEDARRQKWLKEQQTREMFEGKQVIITEKMDGANACLTSEKVYARSHSAEATGEQWDFLKKQHREELMHKIPDNLAIFGEYLYARHSIKYDSLPSYFIVFGIYDDSEDEWLSWVDTEVVADKLSLETAPVIDNVYIAEDRSEVVDERDEIIVFDDLRRDPEGVSRYGDTREGYVVRTVDSFSLDDLTENMAKCVRENHVQTEELHWRKGGSIETNELG